MRQSVKWALLFFVLLLTQLESRAQTTLDTAVDFNVKDIHGNKYILFDILDSGKFVLLDFFSTSCGPCVTYAPDMQQAYLQYGANQGNVVFIGLAWDPSNAAVAAFDSANGITYPTVSGQGYSYQTITAYNCQSFPTTILIAPDRQILAQQIWPPSFQKIDSVLTAALSAVSLPEPIQPSKIRLITTYPNPANHILSCQVYLPDAMDLQYDIFTSHGELIARMPAVWFGHGYQAVDIPVETLRPGMYFVMINAGRQFQASFKFVRQ